jgi:hypothetical protein
LLQSPELLYQIFFRDTKDTHFIDRDWGYKLIDDESRGVPNQLRTDLLLYRQAMSPEIALTYLINSFASAGLISEEKRTEFFEWLSSSDYKDKLTSTGFFLSDNVELNILWELERQAYKITYRVGDAKSSQEGSFTQRRKEKQKQDRKDAQVELLIEKLANPDEVFEILQSGEYPLEGLRQGKDNQLPQGVSIRTLMGLDQIDWELNYGDLIEAFQTEVLDEVYSFRSGIWKEMSPTAIQHGRFTISPKLGQHPITGNGMIMTDIDDHLRTERVPSVKSQHDLLVEDIYLIPTENCRQELLNKADDKLDLHVEGVLERMIFTPTSKETPITIESFIANLMEHTDVELLLKQYGAKGMGEKAKEVFNRTIPVEFTSKADAKLEAQKEERLIEIGQGWHWPHAIKLKRGNRQPAAEIYAHVVGSGPNAKLEYALGACL